MLWNCYFESDKNVSGLMGRMHRLWIERGYRDMSKQRLRTQMQKIKNKKFFFLMLRYARLWGQVEQKMMRKR